MTKTEVIKKYEGKIDVCSFLIKDAHKKLKSITDKGEKSPYYESEFFIRDSIKQDQAEMKCYIEFLKCLENELD